MKIDSVFAVESVMPDGEALLNEALFRHVPCMVKSSNSMLISATTDLFNRSGPSPFFGWQFKN